MNVPSVENVPAHQKGELMKELSLIKLAEGHRLYNTALEHCFMECVKTFRSKTLEEGEKNCLSACSEKYIKLTTRVGYRYAEEAFKGR